MRSIYITLLTKGNRYAKHFLKTASVIAVACQTTILRCLHHLRLLPSQQMSSLASLSWSSPNPQKIIRSESLAQPAGLFSCVAGIPPQHPWGGAGVRREPGEAIGEARRMGETSEIKEQRQAGQGRAGSSGPLTYSQAAPPTTFQTRTVLQT